MASNSSPLARSTGIVEPCSPKWAEKVNESVMSESVKGTEPLS